MLIYPLLVTIENSFQWCFEQLHQLKTCLIQGSCLRFIQINYTNQLQDQMDEQKKIQWKERWEAQRMDFFLMDILF